jgi:hypothetical protein
MKDKLVIRGLRRSSGGAAVDTSGEGGEGPSASMKFTARLFKLPSTSPPLASIVLHTISNTETQVRPLIADDPSRSSTSE